LWKRIFGADLNWPFESNQSQKEEQKGFTFILIAWLKD